LGVVPLLLLLLVLVLVLVVEVVLSARGPRGWWRRARNPRHCIAAARAATAAAGAGAEGAAQSRCRLLAVLVAWVRAAAVAAPPAAAYRRSYMLWVGVPPHPPSPPPF